MNLEFWVQDLDEFGILDTVHLAYNVQREVQQAVLEQVRVVQPGTVLVLTLVHGS
jgi:hypothetical protein